MSDIQFLNNEIVINGVSSTTVAKTLKDSGFKNAAIAEIIGGWFTGVTGATNPAPFQFDTDVETPDPNCQINYKRNFSHTDWIDGESRVQAGMTPEELGFNARFHAIENEFDNIESQFVKLGLCGAELRADLIGVVRELESKITALQNSIHDAKPPANGGPDIIGPIKFGTETGILTKFGEDFEVIKYEPLAVPIKPGPKVNPLDPKAGVFVPKETAPLDFVKVIEGLQHTLEQENGAGELFASGKPVTIGDLRINTPNATLPSGHSLGSVIATLPADTKFTDVNDAVTKITEHVVSQLNRTQSKQLRNSVVTGDNADRTGTSLVNSGVMVLGVDDNTATALNTAGLGTVSKLSNATTGEIAAALTGAGLDANLAGDLFAKATITKALRNF